MAIYLGKIKNVNTFYNFTPLYRYKNRAFEELTDVDRMSILPDSIQGNIALYDSTKPYNSIEFYDSLPMDRYVFFEFETSELEKNIYNEKLNQTAFKADIGTKFADRLKTFEEMGLYRIIHANELNGKIENNSTIEITIDSEIYEGSKAYIQRTGRNKNTYVGPFDITTLESTDGKFIQTNLIENQYILPCIMTDDKNAIVKWYNDQDPFNIETLSYLDISAVESKQNVVDLLPIDNLLEDFRNNVSLENFEDNKIDLSNIHKAIHNYERSIYSSDKKISEDIAKGRIARLNAWLEDNGNVKEKYVKLTNMFINATVNSADSYVTTKVFNALAHSDAFMQILSSSKYFQDKTLSTANFADANSKGLDVKENIIQDKQEVDRLEGVIKEKTKQLKQLQEVLDINSLKKSLTSEVNTLKNQKARLDSKNAELSAKVNKIKSDLTNTIDAALDSNNAKAASLAFDGLLASKLLEAATKWETSENEECYASTISSLQPLSASSPNNEEMIQYICDMVKDYRPNYSRNTILNILICLTQGLITVFSGEPGTGKTSICKILAHILGLTKPSTLISADNNMVNPNRFIVVPVERGWTSKRDFIGYYNPITKQFDMNNKKLYDGLKILDREANGVSTNLPFFILLDEANLSPMEYYWADFMNLCDGINNNSYISLGNNFDFSIPDSLHFMATINNDYTTEALSPRLIDRSWIIRLPSSKGVAKKSDVDDLNDYSDVKIISWEALKDIFYVKSSEIDLTGNIKSLYEELLYELKSLNIMEISSRVDLAIRKYITAAIRCFERDKEYSIDVETVALDYALAQRILPHINGNGEAYKNALESLCEWCNSKSLRKSKDILLNILSKGIEPLFSYQYFC